MDELILVERDGPVATVTLNRPKVLNALNAALLDRLEAVLGELEADHAVRAVVLTGAGDRAFAAGADIGELSALPNAAAGEALSWRGYRLTSFMERMRMPVIAAVNGFALGGGCEIAIACDMRIASENAKFGQPEVNLGIIPGYGGTQRLTRLVGRGDAMYLNLTGETIDAATALRIGLVQKVVPAAELLGEAKRIGAVIASKGPLAIAAAKRAVAAGASMPLGEALAFEAAQFGLCVGTEDAKEGTRAFLEKRAANFAGR